jgi:hypothetical protein
MAELMHRAVRVGGLMSYGIDQADVYRRVAGMTGQVLGAQKSATFRSTGRPNTNSCSIKKQQRHSGWCAGAPISSLGSVVDRLSDRA